MNDRHVSFLIERKEWSQGGVQAEKPIQIESRDAVFRGRRHGNRGPVLVVVLLPEGHHDVQAVDTAPLENHNKLLPAKAG